MGETTFLPFGSRQQRHKGTQLMLECRSGKLKVSMSEPNCFGQVVSEVISEVKGKSDTIA